MRRWLTVIALTIGLALVVTAATAATLPRLLGYACRPVALHCTQRALFKPRLFQLGSHYWFTNVVWKSWNPYAASAIVTLHAQFAGIPPDRPIVDRNTLIIFSRPRTLCGVLTYSQWVSGDGNAAIARKVPGTPPLCLFIVS